MKVLAVDRAALKKKYRALTAIDAALAAVIDADKKRGVDTTIVEIDAKTPAAAKKAIDEIDRSAPDYIALIGGPDVIPYQDLKNPLHSPGGDRDEIVWSDLPYACDAPYGTSISDFTGPSRVVGRIPDLPGVKEPSFLLAVLETAAKWTSGAPKDYSSCFGLSTADWSESTKLSLKALFGDAVSVNLSPDAGPDFDAKMLAARTHFINCHGAPNDGQFYGQKGAAFPISHRAALLASRRFDATVVAAECCYGGQLFTPKKDAWPIAARYLAGGAYAYFGSTTIAYAPATSNGLSDNLCQTFIRKAITGASTGRAVLEARQEYIKSAAGFLGPQDLKTIAQFNLLGDPSIHPVVMPKKRAMGMAPAAAATSVAGRRAVLRADGAALTARRAAMQPIATADSVRDQLQAITAGLGLDTPDTLSFESQRPSTRLGLTGGGTERARFHVVSGRKRVDGATHLPHVVAVVAREVAGKLEVVELHSKRHPER